MALHHMLRAAVQQQAAGPSDPYFYDVSLLLTGDGTNGAQNNTFLDSSSNNFTITRNGNTTQGTFSPYGNLWSNYVDGSGDYLVAADSTAFDLPADYTVEFWVYPTALGSSRSMFCIGNAGSSDGLLLYWSVGDSKIKMYCGGTVIGGSITTNPNTWTHVALVRSGSGTNNTTLYINGVSSGQATNTTSFTGVAGNGVSIGAAYYGSYSEETVGYFSNVRLVKGTAVYTTAFTPPTTPLTAVSGTSLLTCQSNRFIDNSSNNFTLTVNGSPSVQRFSPFNPTAPYSAATIGGSGYFDGSGDYLNTASSSLLSPGSNPFTFECWFYTTTTSTSGNHGLIFLGSSNSSQQTVGVLIGGYTDVSYYNANAFFGGSNVFKKGQWNHIAIVREGTGSNQAYVFVNGAKVATGTDSANYPSMPAYIGRNGWGEDIEGYIAGVRLVIGTALYTGSTYTVPTAPFTAISGTQLLCSMTNAGIPDAAMMNDLETVGNAQVSTSVKKYGTGSLAFDGSGDILRSPDSPNFGLGTGNFTIECWVYTGSPSATTIFLNKRATGSAYGWVALGTVSGNFYAFASSNNSSWDIMAGTSFGAVSTNTWQHVALVRNGTSFVGYVNGVGTTLATSSSAVSTTTSTLNIGGDTDGYSFNGYIDDLRITKGYARYTANFTPPAAALPVY